MTGGHPTGRARAGQVGWLDLSCGVSGDMLLGALVDLGVPLELLAAAVGSLGLPIRLNAAPVARAGLQAVHVTVTAAGEPPGEPEARTWGRIRDLLEAAALKPSVRAKASRVFASLATAEAAVHGVAPEDVHFHEVGALDALADVVGVCAGVDALGLEQLTASRVSLGGGTAVTRHGTLPVPAPAVLQLLRAAGAPAAGGPVDVELCTPTGAALVTTLATGYGPLPPVVVESVGTGAGSTDLAGRPNVARLVVGQPQDEGSQAALLLETNVDDLDPRAWPSVLSALLAAGASDAWITPVLMKKGRPAHTLSVLTAHDQAAAVRRTVYEQTTTLGMRETAVGKHALHRTTLSVDVGGQAISVKTGELPDGSRVNAMPEWDDVVRVARSLNRPVKSVLAEAQGLAVALPRPARD